MHAYHTTSQPTSPSISSSSPQTSIGKAQETHQTKPKTPSTKTVPNYTKTMHAFTLNQLNYLNNTGSHAAPAKPNINYNIKPESITTTTTATSKKPTTTPTKPQYSITTASPLLPLTSPLALKLPPSQSRTQYLSRSLSLLNHMSLDEEPCGPSNTPEPGERRSPPRPSAAQKSAVAKSTSSSNEGADGEMDVDVDRNGDGDGDQGGEEETLVFAMSPMEMLAQGRELEARFEALIRLGGGDGRVGGEGRGFGEAGGLEFARSEARDFAGFGMMI